nr:putative reverse transcriptase domain-containing protein [Tanacetum cinerariifolium]
TDEVNDEMRLQRQESLQRNMDMMNRGKEVSSNSEIPEAMFPLLEEFFDVFHDELPDALQPLYDIQHHIN